MDSLTKSKLERIAKARNGHQVSIFAPMVKAGTDTRKNPIMFKNLVDRAEKSLIEKGLKFSEAKELLAPTYDLIADHAFWTRQDEGLAVFVSRRRFERFRLPLLFEEAVHVGERFVVGPLMPLFAEDGSYFVLAISQQDVKFYEGNSMGCRELPLKGVVKRLEEALWVDDYDHDDITQHAKGPTIGMTGKAGVTAKDRFKTRVERFLRIVDRELQPLLKEERAPLVLAGVEYVRSIFRSLSGYRHILEQGIDGNPERLSLDELHRLSWPLVAPSFRQAKESARAQYLRLVGTGRTSTDAAQIAEAARQGRVDTLFVARPRLRAVGVPAEDEVLNQVAAQTFLADGSVYVIEAEEMPDNARAAALFRY